jgi:hypothetical protein
MSKEVDATPLVIARDFSPADTANGFLAYS